MPQFKVTAWPHIDPGQKRHKINVYAASSTRDAAGQQSTALGDVVLEGVFAKIENFSARQLFQDGLVSQVVHKVHIDWPSARITDDMKVVVRPWQGADASLYEIQAIENVEERNLVMILTCLEIDNALLGSIGS